MATTGTTVKNLYCAKCTQTYPIDSIQTLCACGGPILVDYDYATAARRMDRDALRLQPSSMWKFKPVLPVKDPANIVSLDEGGTPMLCSYRLASELEMTRLFFKDETVNPTGSFKARGLGMAVSRAKELGIDKLIIPTAGNAGSAVAAYAARGGMKCKIVMPKDVPAPFLVDCTYHGAEIELVDGTIADCGKRAAELVASEDWFSLATLKEPYRIEGKKTMGYELAEQFDYDLPDVVIYPTGGGTGLIGMWKAFNEMEAMGWIDGRRPRMVSVQAEGCAPIPRAFEAGAEKAEPWENPETVAAGLRVPGAVGDFLMLRAIRETAGTAVAVSDHDLMTDTRELAAKEGIFGCPEDGATLSCLKRLRKCGWIKPDERVVLFLTGNGYKYLDVLKEWM